jgi:hypothetical protein
VETARKGEEVCIKIEPIPGESPKMFGRHFDETDILVSKVRRIVFKVAAKLDRFKNISGMYLMHNDPRNRTLVIQIKLLVIAFVKILHPTVIAESLLKVLFFKLVQKIN